MSAQLSSQPFPHRVVLVGPCGAGKSTIAKALQGRGVEVVVVGQEHSAIHDLWRRVGPALLVFLDASLAVIRQRRGPDWPAWLYQTEQERLADARAHADLILDTGVLTVDDVVRAILTAIQQQSSG